MCFNFFSKEMHCSLTGISKLSLVGSPSRVSFAFSPVDKKCLGDTWQPDYNFALCNNGFNEQEHMQEIQ